MTIAVIGFLKGSSGLMALITAQTTISDAAYLDGDDGSPVNFQARRAALCLSWVWRPMRMRPGTGTGLSCFHGAAEALGRTVVFKSARPAAGPRKRARLLHLAPKSVRDRRSVPMHTGMYAWHTPR